MQNGEEEGSSTLQTTALSVGIAVCHMRDRGFARHVLIVWKNLLQRVLVKKETAYGLAVNATG
jgi:hypothetical protein